MPKISKKKFDLNNQKEKTVDLLTKLTNKNFKLKNFKTELVDKFDMPKIKSK